MNMKLNLILQKNVTAYGVKFFHQKNPLLVLEHKNLTIVFSLI